MRLRDSGGNPITGGSGQACNSVIGHVAAGGAYSFSGTYELVRAPGTIPATGGVLSGGPTGTGAWAFGVYNTGIVLNEDMGNIYTGSSSIYPTGDMELKSITCNITYPQTVSLPTVSVSNLGSIGAYAGTTSFNIALNCDSNSVVGITLDAAPGINLIDQNNGILGLQSGASSASGLGVQILEQNQNPLPFRVRNDFGTIQANMTFTHSYYARYTRVANPLSPGVVTSAMTFTLDYQ
ncbi:fimbrial protein [Dyella sp. C9]|uniref:fimbrial protein n=1 Tax=Dyella sp. C9 TaxID=2202154 RepID=UPI001300A261|nr:fimbrial protein [Dyella sp. C9]